MRQPASSYQAAGVDASKEERGLSQLLGWLNRTFALPGAIGRPLLENGFFANVHDVGNGLGIAVSTDSPGTKILVAQQVGRYDTIGIDCVAVNVNDVLCVGARPIALVDYLAVQQVQSDMLEQLGKGLYEGAQQAGIAIASGEIAQVPEMLRGASEGLGFDIAGTAIGVVAVDRIIEGSNVQDGDVVVGFRSSGIHSNGLTLARATLLGPGKLSVDSYVSEIGCALGEELLRPTHIYVRPILDALAQTQDIVGLAHISGDGFLNLLRLKTECGFELSDLPDVPPIFRLIQERGNIALEEMYKVFNMGVGFCAVTRPEAARIVLEAAEHHGFAAQVIGHARKELAGQVLLPEEGLVGRGKGFLKPA